MMIKLHHLNASRSIRILWLLEEIGQPYELIKYQRDEKTHRGHLPFGHHPPEKSAQALPAVNEPLSRQRRPDRRSVAQLFAHQ